MVTQQERINPEALALSERVVKISRVAKVVKGGRHLSFSAVVVIGDGAGHVGVGMGKADAVPDAVRKGVVEAKKNMIRVPLKGSTIPHEVVAYADASQVMLKPAGPGTGVIAGGAVRAVVELAGVKDILTKARGSTNPVNAVKAAFNGLAMLKDPQEVLAKRRQLVENPPVRRQPKQGQRKPRPPQAQPPQQQQQQVAAQNG
ncbi:MAG: 30S ribosomal protein S5 [SAR202 cluster bacterium]|nr:30S ribosomal protein S5 [SAR202 cluster bacterium]